MKTNEFLTYDGLKYYHSKLQTAIENGYGLPLKKGLSENSVQSKGCVAGLKGFYWTSIEKVSDRDDEAIIYLSTKNGQFGTEQDFDIQEKWPALTDITIYENSYHYIEVATIREHVAKNAIRVQFFTGYVPNFASKEEHFTNNAVVALQYPNEGLVDFGQESFALGDNCKALGFASIAAGRDNIVTDQYSAAFGRNNKVKYSAAAFGKDNEAMGDASFVAGGNSKANGKLAIAIGRNLDVGGEYNFAANSANYVRGRANVVFNGSADAYPGDTTTDGNFVEGKCSFGSGTKTRIENGTASAAFGDGTYATGHATFVEGSRNKASGDSAHAGGAESIASGTISYAFGTRVAATGVRSYAFGQSSVSVENVWINPDMPTPLIDFLGPDGMTADEIASRWKEVLKERKDSKMTGSFSVSNGKGAITFGIDGLALGEFAIAEGKENIASGNCSHAFGASNIASGSNAIVLGTLNTASGNNSFAGGARCSAEGVACFAFGDGLIATGSYRQAVFGKYNNKNENALFQVGGGSGEKDRKTIFEITKDGKLSLNGITLTSATLEKLINLTEGGKLDKIIKFIDSIEEVTE